MPLDDLDLAASLECQADFLRDRASALRSGGNRADAHKVQAKADRFLERARDLAPVAGRFPNRFAHRRAA